MIDLERILAAAIDAVDMAAEHVRSHPPSQMTSKGDRDMASEVDIAVEHRVRQFLRSRTPDVGFLGEEDGWAGPRHATFWSFDPVDGTANFTRGIELCAVSLALVNDQWPIIGVIDLPFLHDRYWAVEGRGAFKNGERITASATSSLRDVIVSVGDFAVGPDSDEKNRQRLAVVGRLARHVLRVRMLGSAAIDLAWVAEGKLGAAVIHSNKPWDVAAVAVMVREAGALMLDRDGNEHSLESSATTAVTAPLRDALVPMIRHDE